MAEVAAALADPATAWVVRDVESKVRAVFVRMARWICVGVDGTRAPADGRT